MNPKQFLLYSGITLLTLSVLGFVGLGPTVDDSFLGEFFRLDNFENMAHLLLGATALGAYYLLKDKQLQKWIVAAIGGIALFAAVVGFLSVGNPEPNAGMTNFENPADNILHLIVALWAFHIAFISKEGSKA